MRTPLLSLVAVALACASAHETEGLQPSDWVHGFRDLHDRLIRRDD